MRKTFTIFFAAFGLLFIGCEDTDLELATRAGIDAVRAVTLDDEDVRHLSARLSRQSDRQHTVAPPENRYAKRLRRLTAEQCEYRGREFEFKVYLSPTVNAFAMADGTIRIYSGLMDMMNDQELLFVVGHEMGHVIEDHVKEKIRLAYASSAVRKAIASQQNEAGEIARSIVGALAESLLNAQFSKKEEREADDLGVAFLKSKGNDAQPAISALEKLATLGSGHSFLSSHPAPESRAERLRENALSLRPDEKPSILARIIEWLLDLWPFGKDDQASLDAESVGPKRLQCS